MRILIVGGDHLGNIPKKFKNEGVEEIIHWTGRRNSFWNKAVPKKVEKVIIFCDFINHKTMQHVKRQAKEYGIPVIYSKRALSQNLA